MLRLVQILKGVLPPPLFLKLKIARDEARLELHKAITKFRSNNQIFSRIYQRNEWGGSTGEFYSGPGSYEAPVEEYAALVRKFIRENEIDSIVDLGCGDFSVGRRIVSSGLRYVGVDVVKPLVDRNNQMFRSYDISFECLDIAKLLLDHGADMDAQKLDDWTPLHLAVGNHYLEIVEVLLEQRARVDLLNDEGRTPP